MIRATGGVLERRKRSGADRSVAPSRRRLIPQPTNAAGRKGARPEDFSAVGTAVELDEPFPRPGRQPVPDGLLLDRLQKAAVAGEQSAPLVRIFVNRFIFHSKEDMLMEGLLR